RVLSELQRAAEARLAPLLHGPMRSHFVVQVALQARSVQQEVDTPPDFSRRHTTPFTRSVAVPGSRRGRARSRPSLFRAACVRPVSGDRSGRAGSFPTRPTRPSPTL